MIPSCFYALHCGMVMEKRYYCRLSFSLFWGLFSLDKSKHKSKKKNLDIPFSVFCFPSSFWTVFIVIDSFRL